MQPRVTTSGSRSQDHRDLDAPQGGPSRWLLAALVVGFFGVGLLGEAGEAAAFDVERLAKAQPDECFDGIGVPYPPGPPCATGVPKVSESYIWGMVKSGATLFFGTVANVICPPVALRARSFGNMPDPHAFGYVCEFGESQLVPPLPWFLGDHRTPGIYAYDTSTRQLSDLRPGMSPAGRSLLGTTTGLRSAGTVDDVVFFAGASTLGGLTFFAFKTDGTYLGATLASRYSEVRKWVAVGGILYVAVGNRSGGGSVLRWTGSATAPMRFELVGRLDGAGTNIEAHDGRLFATTWPVFAAESVSLAGGPLPVPLAGLWMSPPIPTGGLTRAHRSQWKKVWNVFDYEPDLVIALSYGGGELASFGGYLYWGTMHSPGFSAEVHEHVYGIPGDPEDLQALLDNSPRRISIWRGRNFSEPSEEIELLYGEAALPAFVPGTGWVELPNRHGSPPLHGPSGFGNEYNFYTWTMEVFGGELYVGTYDGSILALVNALPAEASARPLAGASAGAAPSDPFGGDLYKFSSVGGPASPVNVDGFGNPLNYGIRTMVSDEDARDGDDGMYLGLANPFSIFPNGGWELVRFNP